MLTLKDELAQEGMESVTSNDPRTGFNLGKHLITSSIVAHKISVEELATAEIAATSYLENYTTKRWTAEETRYRRMGRQSFKGQLVGLMLATGWISVFSMVEEDKIWSEVWNPYEVFPEFGRDGMIEVVHIYSVSPSEANLKAKNMGWNVKTPFTSKSNLYNYWGFDDSGDVVNGIILGQDFVKELQVDVNLTNLSQKLGKGILPVFMTPVGGLPDMGAIDAKWQEHFGEGMVATNEALTKNYDKMLTYTQQLIRDTANPRWFERSSGETPILTEENMFKRGAIFRGAPGEDIMALPVPPIPVELSTTMFNYQNMLQRGAFPWAVYGNIQQQMSYLAMANIASAALQVLTPYMDGYRGLLSDLDNYWYNMIEESGYRPHKFNMPKNLPEEFEFEVQAEIEIPGFLIQRATVARMLDPTFRLSTTTVMDRMFPEIRDSLREQAKARKDDAMMHPKAIMVDQIIAYREQAKILRDAQDVDSAELYEALAESMKAELTAPAPQPTGGLASPAEPGRDVYPTREATAPVEGLGRV